MLATLAARQINPNASAPDSQSSLHSGGDRAGAVLELSTGRVGRRLEGRSRTKRPRLAGCKGRGRWRRVCSNAHFRQIIPAAIVTGVDRIRCSVTQIFRYRLTRRLRSLASHHPAQPYCRAIKTRATKGSIAFLAAGPRPFHTMEFSRCWARFR
jgi:hypothetical protein